jgi:hypothetical protein
MALSVYKLIPSTEELTDLEMRVSHILGWQAGTVEIRETIREFRLGNHPTDRYSAKQIDKLREVISPTQSIDAGSFKVNWSIPGPLKEHQPRR